MCMIAKSDARLVFSWLVFATSLLSESLSQATYFAIEYYVRFLYPFVANQVANWKNEFANATCVVYGC